jgi:hypothetical protein
MVIKVSSMFLLARKDCSVPAVKQVACRQRILLNNQSVIDACSILRDQGVKQADTLRRWTQNHLHVALTSHSCNFSRRFVKFCKQAPCISRAWQRQGTPFVKKCEQQRRVSKQQFNEIMRLCVSGRLVVACWRHC